jgi:hypothetical protein
MALVGGSFRCSCSSAHQRTRVSGLSIDRGLRGGNETKKIWWNFCSSRGLIWPVSSIKQTINSHMIAAALRSAGRRAGTTALSRNFMASSAKAGGHGGPAYEHAEHMYDIGSISNRGLKFVLHAPSRTRAQNTLSPTILCPNPQVWPRHLRRHGSRLCHPHHCRQIPAEEGTGLNMVHWI